MKYSVKFSDAIHIMAYIEIFQGTDLSSETIASSVNINPVQVRRIMANLKQSALITTQTGKATPRLTRSPSEITFHDIYQSVEPEPKFFRIDENTTQACLVGGNIQKVLTAKYAYLQAIIEHEMKQMTLEQVIDDIHSSEAQRST